MKQLLLVHGAIGASDQLIPLKNLLKNDFTIHLLEFEGHGRKSSLDSPFSLEGFKEQLDFALSQIDEPTDIFGYSMGGFIALLCAAEKNDKIASLITLGTKMTWDREIANHQKKNLDPDTIREKVPKFADSLQKRHGDKWEKVLYNTAAFMEELGRTQPINAESMANIKIPVQLCLADQDRMVSIQETQLVSTWIAGSYLKTIRSSKHPIEQVNLTELADTIRSFFHKS